MKSVLWISRHEMTHDQLSDLERIMGEPVKLLPWRDTVLNFDSIVPLMKACDAIAAVLPPELLGKLLRISEGKPVLRAIAGRIPTGNVLSLPDGRQEPEFAFVHRGWEQILRFEMESRVL